MTEPLLGIYIHIPFCRKLCAYCDFVRYPFEEALCEAFLKALCVEIASFDGPTRAKTLFLGGGTPSILTERQLESLFSCLFKIFEFSSPEISMEVNPDDVTAASVQCWKRIGVNRVSIGVQSFDDTTLSKMERRHDAKGALHAIDLVAGHFNNWGIDLIYGASTQHAWQETLNITDSLSPPHVSTYALSYIPGTPMYNATRARMEDDTVLQLYQDAESMLARYEHYEISNFALAGFQCRHNLIYWKNECYAGFGPGAYSFVDRIRMANPPDLKDYVEYPGRKAEVTQIDLFDEEVETLIQHFRLREGISPGYYEKRFCESMDKNFGVPLRILMERGLLESHEGRIRPTAQGFYLNDEIGLLLVK